MNNFDLTNHFLIAMPSLRDPNFAKTVTYICAHNHEGAMGIVINRPLDLNLGEVLSQMELVPSDPRVNQFQVFNGGPVQSDRGFIICRPLGGWSSLIKVSNDYGVATSRDVLEAICEGTGPENTLVALGYAGWTAGQLEQEMADNAWLSVPANDEIMFKVKPNRRWESAAALMGIDLHRVSFEVGHA